MDTCQEINGSATAVEGGGGGAQLVRSWTRGSCSSIQQIPSRVATPALGAGWRLFALTGSIEARRGAAGGEGGRGVGGGGRGGEEDDEEEDEEDSWVFRLLGLISALRSP